MDELVAEFSRAETLLAAQRISDTGHALELALARFLARLLPTHIGIGRGHVASRDWKSVSEEIDIVLYDRRYAAGFPYLGGTDRPGEHLGLFAADAVLGCMAVTKTLTKQKLKSSIANLESVTELAPADMSNQLHFDLPVGGAMSFRGGVLLNPILSCVVGYNDQIFTSMSRGRRTRIEAGRELDLRLDSLTDIDGFCGAALDLVYTVDGILMYPMAPTADGLARHPPPEDWIGQSKGFAEVVVEDSEVSTRGGHVGDDPFLVFEDHRDDNPAAALKLFLLHVITACSWMVKRTPDLNPLIEDPSTRKVKFPLRGRLEAEKAMKLDGAKLPSPNRQGDS